MVRTIRIALRNTVALCSLRDASTTTAISWVSALATNSWCFIALTRLT